jgi:SAM-dependent methyltransferase
LQLPFADNSVDLAMCSLTLHHFAPEPAVALLRELQRVARHGVIVNDIVRSWPGLLGAWLLGRLVSRNRLTRHDGLVSVRRAYTPAELHVLAQQAGLDVVSIRGLLGYRLVLSLR